MTTQAAEAHRERIRHKILLVEDEADIRELVRYNLAQEGFIVEEAADADTALDRIGRRAPDLMVLDLMLPGMSGLELCRRMRSNPETAKLPILVVTAKGAEVDRILGLEMGADDYVVKPFSPREVVARVKALLRRANPASEPASPGIYDRGRLKIDFGTYEVFVEGKRRSWRCASSSCCVFSCSIRCACTAASNCSTWCGAATLSSNRARLTFTSAACASISSATTPSRS